MTTGCVREGTVDEAAGKAEEGLDAGADTLRDAVDTVEDKLTDRR